MQQIPYRTLLTGRPNHGEDGGRMFATGIYEGLRMDSGNFSGELEDLNSQCRREPEAGIGLKPIKVGCEVGYEIQTSGLDENTEKSDTRNPKSGSGGTSCPFIHENPRGFHFHREGERLAFTPMQSRRHQEWVDGGNRSDADEGGEFKVGESGILSRESKELVFDCRRCMDIAKDRGKRLFQSEQAEIQNRAGRDSERLRCR